MNASEFRIGNYIKCYGEICEITLIGNKGFSAKYDGENGKCSVKFTNPTLNKIPLTEEFLVKFGFKKLNHLGMFVYVLYIDEWLNFEVDLKHSTFHLVSGQENNDLNIDIGSYTVYRLIEIQFIHEIQNLYFALTAKDLSLS